MTNIVSAKGGDFSVGEAFGIGLSKMLAEQMLTPFIGNGNAMSGIAKVIMAVFAPKVPFVKGVVSNKVGKAILTGVLIDGTEDLLRWIFKGGVASASSQKRLW